MKEKIKKIEENVYEIPKQGKMLVPGRLYASEEIMKKIVQDKTVQQIKNVAHLPGIISASLAMPDAHQGYGFPIGGVAAFNLKKGVVSPGGVGFDINCGVRLLASNITKKEFLTKRDLTLKELQKNVPAGVGTKSEFALDNKEINEVLQKGVEWAIQKGLGTKEDAQNCEDNGQLTNANPTKVSMKAKGRGMHQLGSLGAGNHFLEVQEVQEIYDKKTAKTLGITKEGQITIMIHSGSRGLGHQIASDYIRLMEEEYGIKNLPDRQLINAPINSELGKNYMEAMAAGANFGFANRQVITYQTRKSLKKYFPKIRLDLVYDIAHNIAKIEEHTLKGKKMRLCVHRKGAARSFGPGREEIPKKYKRIGSPIFLPGSMGTASYVLCGTKKAEEKSFGSTAHGAGRLLSRSHAKNNLKINLIKKELEEQNVKVRAGSQKGLLEEAPEAYKDINEIVRVSDQVGITRKIAKLKPLGVIKG